MAIQQCKFGIGSSRNFLLQLLEISREPASFLVKPPSLGCKVGEFSSVLRHRFAACLSDSGPTGHDFQIIGRREATFSVIGSPLTTTGKCMHLMIRKCTRSRLAAVSDDSGLC